MRVYSLDPNDNGGVKPGEIVVAERSGQARLGPTRRRIVERLGREDDARAISLICIHAHGIPDRFPARGGCAGAADAPPVAAAGREDLRELPLVTIDGDDARDFDDAVFAEPDADPANPGGWRLLVAIADVAHYVRPGARSTARRASAATRSISPTAWCRCCRRSCPTAGAR